MLSLADTELVQRDSAIAGLATLLDEQHFAATLRSALPEAQVQAARASYVRYKPGTNCLVCYRVTTPRGETWVYARAYAAMMRDKLGHVRNLSAHDGALGIGGLAIEDRDIAVYSWPHDRSLRSLGRLTDPEQRARLLKRLAPEQPALWAATLTDLRYKPERRYVGLVAGPSGERALLKLYAEQEYPAALAGARAFQQAGGLALSRLMGQSDRHHALLFDWLPGQALSNLLTAGPADMAVRAAGAALAELHSRAPRSVSTQLVDAADPAEPLRAAAAMIGALCPELGAAVEQLGTRLAAELASARVPPTPIHGDFHAGQVLVDGDRVALLDLDNCAWGDPAADLGSFAAHLLYRTIVGELTDAQAERAIAELLAGYRSGRPPHEMRDPHLQTAAWLLRLAPEAFRYRAPTWPETMRATLARAEELAAHGHPHA